MHYEAVLMRETIMLVLMMVVFVLMVEYRGIMGEETAMDTDAGEAPTTTHAPAKVLLEGE